MTVCGNLAVEGPPVSDISIDLADRKGVRLLSVPISIPLARSPIEKRKSVAVAP